MNHTELIACVAELNALRYTPAGVPALDVVLEHQSQQEEAEQPRQVKLKIRALALGVQAERLAKQEIGSQWRFSGFLSNPRQGKSVVLHIQEFQQN